MLFKVSSGTSLSQSGTATFLPNSAVAEAVVASLKAETARRAAVMSGDVAVVGAQAFVTHGPEELRVLSRGTDGYGMRVTATLKDIVDVSLKGITGWNATEYSTAHLHDGEAMLLPVTLHGSHYLLAAVSLPSSDDETDLSAIDDLKEAAFTAVQPSVLNGTAIGMKAVPGRR
jgi:hypothetical protein